MKRLILLLPLLLLLGGCNIKTYDDYCQPLAMEQCKGYDYYKFKTYSNTNSDRRMCSIKCLTISTGRAINIVDDLNHNKF